jgi:hypothetical protein
MGPHLQERVIREILDHSIHCLCRSAAPYDRHPLAMPLVTPYGHLYDPLPRIHQPIHQRHIGLGDLSALELPLKCNLGRLVFGNEDQTRGILVQPVYDSGSFRATYLGDLGAVGQYSVDQCASRMPESRVDDHTRRFAHCQQVLILISNIKRDTLRENRLR